MNFKELASTLLKLANRVDSHGFTAEADALTLAAEGIVRIAQENNKSIHFNVTRGPAGLIGKIEVREKMPLADEFTAPTSTEPLEIFEFKGANLNALKTAANPTLEQLKKKYGLEQILENISI